MDRPKVENVARYHFRSRIRTASNAQHLLQYQITHHIVFLLHEVEQIASGNFVSGRSDGRRPASAVILDEFFDAQFLPSEEQEEK